MWAGFVEARLRGAHSAINRTRGGGVGETGRAGGVGELSKHSSVGHTSLYIETGSVGKAVEV